MPKIPALINITAAAVNIILAIFLIAFLSKINPSYGLIGASLATFVSRYAGLFAIAFFTRKKIKIHPKKESILKPLFASLLMLGYLFLFKSIIPLTIFTGIIMIVSAAILYLVIILLLKSLDLKELRGFIKSK